MLSYYQTETVAYTGDGFIVCRACAVKRDPDVGEEGRGELHGIIRYTVDEMNSERAYEYFNEAKRALERAGFGAEYLKDGDDEVWEHNETCEDCGEEIV